jgi:transcriptional regulator with XRE-family HTH domain
MTGGPVTAIDVELARRIRAAREAAGLSQTEVGVMIGVSYQQMQKYEHGRNRLSVGRLIRIATALGIPASTLIEGLEEHLDPPAPGVEPKRKLR